MSSWRGSEALLPFRIYEDLPELLKQVQYDNYSKGDLVKELVLIGGHPSEDSDIHRYLASRARMEGEIGYIHFASSEPKEQIAKMERTYDQYDIKVRNIQNVNDCYGLSVIYMGGGDPEKLVS